MAAKVAVANAVLAEESRQSGIISAGSAGYGCSSTPVQGQGAGYGAVGCGCGPVAMRRHVLCRSSRGVESVESVESSESK